MQMIKKAAAAALAFLLLLLQTPMPVYAAEDIAWQEEVDAQSVGQQKLYVHERKTTDGAASQNMSQHDYWNCYGDVTKSYLTQNSDKTYTRVEQIGNYVYIENYSSAFKLRSTKKIKKGLPLFGGCFFGKTHNYMVFGQDNFEQDNAKEVLRVVKYDKSWNKLATEKIYGANTCAPFSHGGLSMTESGGLLYIHTCHEMYAYKGGVRHQANMTFVVDEAAMKVVQKSCEVSSIRTGYVSHSFNQFAAADEEYLYRLDHGDAYPRAVVLTKAPKYDIRSSSNTEILKIVGEPGENATGVQLGGLVLAGDKLVAVGNSRKQDAKYEIAYGQENIFVSFVDTDLKKKQIKWLTSSSNDNITRGNPQIVKASEKLVYVLWEECNVSTGKWSVKIVGVDTDGNTVMKKCSVNARLSDCTPIYTASGKLLWYVTGKGDSRNWYVTGGEPEATAPVFYLLDRDPEKEPAVKEESISKAKVNISAGSYAYNGKAKRPKVTVVLNKKTLKENKDFTVSYKNNKNIGEAVITITGKGNYKGKAYKKFKITAKKGSVFTVGANRYKITNSSEVSFAGIKSEKEKKVSVPATVKIGWKTFKVTSVSEKALYRNTKVTSVVLGTNIKKIDSRSFFGCKKLGIISIRSKKLKSVGKNAFQGIKPTAEIKVPKEKWGTYKKLLRNKGQGRKVQIVKG